MIFNIIVPDVFGTEQCNLGCDYCFEYKSKRKLEFEDFKEYIDKNAFLGFFVFGGEPLLATDLWQKIIDYLPEKKKDCLQTVITNGTLIKYNVDFLKRNNMYCQISVDGCKEANDMHRKYLNGKGTFDDIEEAINICIENGIRWTIHAVLTMDTIPYLFESLKWFLEMQKKNKDEDFNEFLKGNSFFCIFEQEYNDKITNIFMEQIEKICDWLYNDAGIKHEWDYMDLGFLDHYYKATVIKNFFYHHGDMCGAGVGLLALDSELNVYPCHRLATVPEKEKYCLGNVYEAQNFNHEKMKIYNSYQRIKRYQYMYSAVHNLDGYKNPKQDSWYNWCPSTNLQTSGTIYYQNCKYNVMIENLNKFKEKLVKKYGL